MNGLKVIEVLGQSAKSWEDAAEEARRQTSKTFHNIKSVRIQDRQAMVDMEGHIVRYRVNARISFVPNGLASRKCQRRVACLS